MLPSPDILNDFEQGRFVLSNLAAKRANQIKEGAPPLVQIDSHHPLTIALAEIAAGKIRAILNAVEESVEEAPSLTLIGDEPLPAELGMLLPALDEAEVELVSIDAVLAQDDEHDLETDESDGVAISLADLADDDDEESATPVAPEDETLSLTDVAEQENLEEEESEE